jgi:diacylglycerol kinase
MAAPAGQTEATATPPKSPRSWPQKFREAFRGAGFGIRGQSSFVVHFASAALVVVAAAVLQCELIEWCVLIGCVGAVLTAEMFNSALETMFLGLEPGARDRHFAALEIAAGAVLTASVTAAVIGFLVLGRRVWVLLT